jgi:hypothetical protein
MTTNRETYKSDRNAWSVWEREKVSVLLSTLTYWSKNTVTRVGKPSSTHHSRLRPTKADVSTQVLAEFFYTASENSASRRESCESACSVCRSVRCPHYRNRRVDDRKLGAIEHQLSFGTRISGPPRQSNPQPARCSPDSRTSWLPDSTTSYPSLPSEIPDGRGRLNFFTLYRSVSRLIPSSMAARV